MRSGTIYATLFTALKTGKKSTFITSLLASMLVLCGMHASAQTITTIAGNHALGSGYSGDGGQATAAKLNNPLGVAFDASGNMYIADFGNDVVRKVTTSGIISTIAGVAGTTGVSGDGAAATLAHVESPYSVAVDASGNVYIADFDNSVIRKVSTSGIISTFAGTIGISGYSGDGGPASAAKLNNPWVITFDATGNMYIADEDNSVIRKINTAGTISTFAGNHISGTSGDGGAATLASLVSPSGVAVDGSGNVYISTQGGSSIRKVNTSGIISTFAGNSSSSGFSGDGGAATVALLDGPIGVAADAAGNVYIVDQYNSRIRKVNTSGIISTLTGTGSFGFSGDGGPASAAAINEPFEVNVDASGIVYFADFYNNVVRRISTSNTTPTFTGGSPQSLTVCISSGANDITSLLHVSDADAGQTETWSQATAPGHGTLVFTSATAASGTTNITPGGTITYAPTTGYTGSDVFVVQVSDGTATTTTTINVTVSALPTTTASGTAEICSGSSSTLTAGGTATSFTWSPSSSLSASTGSSVSASPTSTTTYTVTGSLSGCTSNATVTVTTDGGTITATTGAAICAGISATLTATPSSGATVAWYQASSGDSLMGLGNRFLTPTTITSTTTYYAQALALNSSTSNSLTYTNTANNGNTGIMFEVKALTNTNITAFDYELGYFTTGDASGSYAIYFYNGPLAGHDLSSTGWVQVGSYSGISAASPNTQHFQFSLPVPVVNGRHYAFYITETSAATSSISYYGAVSGTPPTIPTGTAVATSSDFIIYSGEGKSTPIFTVAPNANRTPLVKLYYSTACSVGGRSGATVTVNPLPTLGVSPSVAICSGNSTGLTATGGITYTWSPSTALTATTGASVTANPTSPTTYTVTGTNGTGCSNSATVTVSVNPLPTVSGGSNVAICSGSNTTLTASGASTYTWSPSSSLSASTGTSVTAHPTSPTTYTVTGTNGFGCSNTATVTVSVNTLPTVSGGSSVAVCSGSSATLTASGATTYTWAPSASLSASTGTSVTATPSVGTTTYTVTGSNGTCSNTAIVTVTMNPAPGAIIVPGGGTPGIINLIAGNGSTTYTGDGNPATVDGMSGVSGIVTDASGNIYYTDYGNQCVRKINTSGIVTTIAGINAAYGFSGDGGPATAASLASPFGLALDASGNLYIADQSNSRVRKVSTSGIITTFAGGGSSLGDGGPATAASIGTVLDMVFDAAGNMYLTDRANDRIRKVNTSGIISTLAGNGGSTVTGDGGPATAAGIGTPFSLALDAAGNIYLGTDNTGTIRIINASGIINTYAGNGGSSATGDGSAATAAQIGNLYNGVCIDASGNLYIASSGTNKIRQVNPSGIISTFAGTGSSGSTGDGGPATAATLSFPWVLATDASGNILEGEDGGNRVRKISVTSTGGGSTVCTGTSITLSDATSGGTWTSSNTNATVVGSTGVVTGVTAGTSTITYTLPTTCFTTTTLTINAAPTVSGGSNVAVCSGSSTTLTATGATTYTWSPSSTLSASTGTSVIATPGVGVTTYTVTGSNGTCSNTATVTVTMNATPTISAVAGPAVCSGFSTTITASGGVTYTWSPGTGLSATTGTTVNANPTSSTTYTVTGTSSAGCPNTAVVTVTINPIPTISGGSNVTICSGTSTILTATGGSTYTWGPSGGLSTTTGSTVTANPTTTTTYTVTGTSTFGCVNKATVRVSVNPSPSAISGLTTACIGTSNTLLNAVAGGIWTSSNTSVATIGTASGTYTGVAGGSAIITYTLTGPCLVTASILISPQPVVTGITPSVGYPASSVTITGTGFNSTIANDIVYFGATRATVGSASPTSLTVTVPLDATFGAVNVENTACALQAASITNYLQNYNNAAYIPNTVNLDPQFTLGTGATPWDVAFGDIDGDGKADIVVSNNGSNTVSIFRNISTSGSLTSGSFASGLTFATGSGPIGIAIGDVDGDGKLDIATANSGTTTVSVLRNTSTSGSISFSTHVDFSTGASAPTNVIIGDVDGDGKPELIACNFSSGNMSILQNTAVSGTITTSSFAGAVTFGAGTNPEGLAFGDIDGDGKPDIGVSNRGSNNISLFRNTATTGIINSGTVASAVNFTTNTSPVGIKFADIDGDGKLDVVEANNGAGVNNISVFHNTATAGVAFSSATLAAHIDFSTVSNPFFNVGVGDIDGDGKPDLVGTNSNSGTIFVFRNTATSGTINSSSFATRADFIAAGGTTPNEYVTAVGDLDGDGKADIVVSNQTSATISVFRNDPLQPITGVMTVCSAGATTTLSEAAQGGTWISGATGTATVGSTGIVTGVTAGTVNISYTGPGGSAVATVTVLAAPATIGGSSTVCTGFTTTLTDATSGGTWTSSTPANATIGSASGIVTGFLAGTTNIVYATPNGCSASTVITVNTTPAVIVGATTLCSGNTTTLTDASGGGTWSSTTAAVGTISTPGGVLAALSGGTTTISYTIPATGCFVTRIFTVNQTPSAITGTPVVCVGATSPLGDAFSGGTWTSGTPTLATVGVGSGTLTGYSAGNPIITYTLPAGCFATVVATINAIPSSAFTVTPNPVCITTANTFTATVGGAASYSWSFGDATTGTGTSLAHTYTATGTFTPTLTVTSAASCSTKTTAAVTVNALPAAITGSTTVCFGLTTVLNDATGTGAWSSGTPGVATIGSSSGVVTGVTAGTTNITYTTRTGCITTRVETVNPAPAAIVITNVCPGTSATLTDATSGGTWTSSNTSVATIGGTTGLALGVAPGTSTITYTLPTGCLITAVETVNPLPAAISGTLTVCQSSTTALTDATSGGSWTSVTTSAATIGSTGIVTGASAGTSVISYTLPTGCAASATVTVNPLPATITGTPFVCTGSSTPLSTISTGGTWSSSNTLLGTVGTTGIVAGLSAGIPNIVYTFPTGCFTSVPVTVSTTPAAITGTPSVCAGSTVLLSDITTGGTWSSSITATATAGSTGIISGVTAGTTNIVYSSAAGCTATLPFTVNITPSVITGTTNICTTTTVTLTSTPAGGTWTSSNPAFATAVSGTGAVTGVSAGVPFITYTLTTGSCKAVAPVTVLTTPAAIAGTPSVCTGLNTSLSDATGGGTWSSITTSVATIGTTGIVNGASAGTSIISYTTPNGCANTVNVTVNASPAATTGSSGVCLGTPTVLTNSTSGGTWTSSNTAVATVTGGTVSGVTAGTVTISYTVSPGSCSALFPMTVNPTPAAITGINFVCTGLTRALGETTPGGTWSSTLPANATIGSATGVVSGITAGTTTTISYTLAAGCTAVFPMSVNLQPAALTGVSTVCTGLTSVLGETTTGGTWNSSNAAIAGVVTGTVTGVASGTATISYNVLGCVAATVMTVNPSPAAITGPSAVCATFSITEGDLTPGGVWTSSAPTTASIGSITGIVSGLIAGPATITYTLPAGCTSINNITVNALPNVYTITGGGGYCAGGAGLDLGLSGSDAGVSYQLFLGSIASGAAVIGGGGTVDFGFKTAAGTYTVIATNPATSCTKTIGTTTVTINAIPTMYTVTGGGGFCAGGTGLHIGLSGSNIGVNYQLLNNGSSVGLPSISGTGVLIDYGLETAGGTYTVLATNPATSCSVTTTSNKVLTVNPLPTPYTVTGGGVYCTGSAGVHIGVANSDGGISYQLFRSTTAVGAPITGTTGTPIDFGLITTVGTYTVFATNTATGCGSSMSNSVSVTVNPIPTQFIVTGGGGYCPPATGSVINLSNSTLGVSYQVFQGGTAVGGLVSGTGSPMPVGTFSVVGTYTVQATFPVSTCSVNMLGSASVSINPLPTAFSVTGGGPYCAGGTGVHVFLSNSTTGVNYQLYNGTTTSGFPVAGTGLALDFGAITAVGTYTVSAVNPTTTCANGMSGSQVVTINPLPTPYTMTPNGGYCSGGTGYDIQLVNSDAGVSYQLYRGTTAVSGVIAGTAGTAIDYGNQTVGGVYTVQATVNATTCKTTMTGSTTVTVNPLPTAFTTGGGGGYCTGGTGAHITLSNSTVGVNYQLSLSGTPTGAVFPGTGFALDLGAVTTTGAYTIVATNPATSCTSNMTGTVTVSLNALPTTYTVGGGGGYCTGGTGAHVTLSNSTTGVRYQLFYGTTPLGTLTGTTSSSLDFGAVTGVGTYSVSATNITTGCTSNMTGTATVSLNPLPTAYTVTVGSGGAYCAGGTGVPVGLAASTSGITYSLFRGGSTLVTTVSSIGVPINFGNQTTAGVYTVVATDPATSCTTGMSGSASVTINPLPATFAVSGGGGYCPGGTGSHITLSGSATGINYQLSNAGSAIGTSTGSGGSLDFGLETLTGTYTVMAINPVTTCTVNMTGNAVITINPIPTAATVAGGGTYCTGGTGVNVTLSSSVSGTTYQLYNGTATVGLPASGSGSLITFGPETAAGTYTVVATNALGCTNNMTSNAVVSITSLPTPYPVTGGGNYCSGGTGSVIGLGGSLSGVNYELYLGGTTTGVTFTGTGSAFTFPAQTAAGYYTVVATGACSGPMTGSTVVSVNPTPNTYTVTGGGSYCAGSTGLNVSLSGSQTGTNYQLYSAGVLTGSVLPGTGGPLNFGPQTAAGNYNVYAITPATTCNVAMNDSVAVNVNMLPAIQTVTGGGNFCSGTTGATITLGGSVLGTNYQLYNGSSMVGTAVSGTGSAITFGPYIATGVYTVTAIDGTTLCTANMSGTDTINVSPLPVAYTVSGGGSYCAGSTPPNIILSGSQTGTTYQVLGGTTVVSPVTGTGSSINFGIVPGAGTYTVKAVATTGCINTMTGSATISINAVPNAQTITGGGGYCTGTSGVHIGLAVSDPGITYRLYDGGTAVGSTVAGTGSSIDFGVIATTGIYKIKGTNVSTSCAAYMTDSAIVSINPLPNTYTVTGSSAGYCAGGTGVSINLSSSDTVTSYQLFNGTTPVGTAMLGTEAGLTFGLETIAGTYTVVATNSVTGCSQTMTGRAPVAIYPTPSAYAVIGGGGYCAGSTGVHIGLANSQPGVNYQLETGSTPVGSALSGTTHAIDFGSLTTTGTYFVMATSTVTGCTDTMTGTASVILNAAPVAYTVTGGGNYCIGATGDSVGISLSDSGINYQLYYGTAAIGSHLAGTGSAISFGRQTGAGIYTAIATNATTGCTTNIAGSALVTISSLPAAFTVTGGGNYCPGATGVHIGLSGSASGVTYQLYNNAVPVTGGTATGTGSLVDFGLETATGTYTVVATNTGTGCTSNMTGATTVSINALPTAYNVTGGGSYCTGAAGVHIGLSGSAAGVTYQLYHGSPVGSSISGTGPLDFGTFTTLGAYTVVATTTATGCTNNMIGSASIIAITSLTSTVSITTLSDTVCSGTATSFAAIPVNGGTTPAYNWKINGVTVNNDSTYTYLPLNGDVVSITLTSSIACATPSSVTATVTMNVLPREIPTVAVTSDPGNTVCTGTAVTFTAAPTYGGTTPAYVWMVGTAVQTATTNVFTYTPANNDVVYVKMTSGYQCALVSTVASTHITMVVDVPVIPIVTITANPGLSIANGEPVAFVANVTNSVSSPSFQWVVNTDTVLGATSAVFSPDELHNQDVVKCYVTTTGTCSGTVGSSSVTITISNVGVKQVSATSDDIQLTPNPNKGTFTVKGTLGTIGDDNLTLEITDMIGQVVYTNKITAHNGVINEKVQLSNSLANGMYILNVKSDTGNKVFHMVVEQ